jgi:hypothetical protein
LFGLVFPLRTRFPSLLGLEDGVVHTQSKFSGGKKVVNGKVEVFDQEGKRLLEGVTNKEGEFSFNAPARYRLGNRFDSREWVT